MSRFHVVLVQCIGLTALFLSVPPPQLEGATVPYAENFDSYLAGQEVPADFTPSDDNWKIVRDETGGFGDNSYQNNLFTAAPVFSSTSLPLTNLSGHNFTLTINFAFGTFTNSPIADASTSFSFLGGYRLTYYILSGRDYNPGAVVLSGSESDFSQQRNVPVTQGAPYQLKVHGAYVKGSLFLEATLSNGTTTRSVYMIDDTPLSGQEFTISNKLNGSVGRSAQMGIDYDDFAVKFETGPPGQMLNLSTRAVVGAGENVAIAGFIIAGNEPKRVVIRGVTPYRGSATGPVVVEDPTLEVYAADGTIIAANDDWQQAQQGEISNLGLQPLDPRDSAVAVTLSPGYYTAVLAGKDDNGGVGIVELYDISRTTDSRLANISTRGAVGTGDDVMIAGVILRGDTARRVVVRALGPSLEASGVAGVLADPVLELHDRNGELVASNDSWRDGNAKYLQDVGLAPTDDREAAIVAELLPTNYTAIVRGTGDTTGVALVEIYDPQ